MQKSKISYFKSCKTLPLYNLYEILNTGNYNWLRIGYDENSEDIESQELSDAVTTILEQYSFLIGNDEISKNYMKLAQVREMEMELTIVATLLSLLTQSTIRPEIIIKEIRKWGYDPDNLDKSLKDLEGLKFRISIFKGKNKEVFEKKEIKDGSKQEKYNLYKDIASVEYSLGTGIVIDPHTTVVEKWANYILIIEKKNEQRSN